MANPFIIPAVAQVGSTAISAIGQSGSAKKQRQFDMEMAKYAYGQDLNMWKRQSEWNKNMWELENQYNLPSNQMQRLRDAGLNPNLMYGSGSQGGTASSIRAAETPRYQNVKGQFNFPDLSSMNIVGEMLNYQNLKKVQAETNLLDERRLTEIVQRHGSTYDNAIKYQDAKYAEQLIQNRLKQNIAEAGLSEIRLSREREMYSNTVKMLEEQLGYAKANKVVKQLEAKIADELGLRPQDPLYLRLLMQALNKVLGTNMSF